LHGKNDFAEGSTILLDTNLKTILLDCQNNFVETLKIMNNAVNNFDILATNLSVHNYFNSLTELFFKRCFNVDFDRIFLRYWYMYIFSFIFYINKLYFARYKQHVTTLRNFNEMTDESFHIRYNFFTKQIEHGARTEWNRRSNEI